MPIVFDLIYWPAGIDNITVTMGDFVPQNIEWGQVTRAIRKMGSFLTINRSMGGS
jgi:hypothetical protein